LSTVDLRQDMVTVSDDDSGRNSMIRPTHPRTALHAAALSAAVLLWGAHTAWAVTVAVQSASGNPGGSVDVCINMTDSGRDVAGVQMDLGWDNNCMSVNMGGEDGGPDCRPNPATRKIVKSASQGNSRLRILMFSTSDTNPIPDNVQLFCCGFTI